MSTSLRNYMNTKFTNKYSPELTPLNYSLLTLGFAIVAT
jgi:hypothetical protein